MTVKCLLLVSPSQKLHFRYTTRIVKSFPNPRFYDRNKLFKYSNSFGCTKVGDKTSEFNNLFKYFIQNVLLYRISKVGWNDEYAFLRTEIHFSLIIIFSIFTALIVDDYIHRCKTDVFNLLTVFYNIFC